MKDRVHISCVWGINPYSFWVHIDGALMMTAPNLALFHKASLGLFPAYVHNFDRGGPHCKTRPNLRD